MTTRTHWRGIGPAPAVLALAGLSLAACAPTVRPGRLAAPAVAPAPAPTPDYDWFLHIADGEASLAYGLEASDHLKLGLDCTKNAGRLTVSALAPSGARPEILLESGGETERLAARAEPANISDDDYLTASAPSDLPVFQRFRRVGWIALWRGETREAFAPHPRSSDQIGRFFEFCG